MVSCVANPHESEAMCAVNKRRESNRYSEIVLFFFHSRQFEPLYA